MKREYDLICVGMALVDSIIGALIREAGFGLGIPRSLRKPERGRQAVNEAMAAVKLGLKTAILCGLGEDGAGDMVLDALRRCGVDTSLVVRSAEHPTPVTTMFVRDDGSRQSITNASHTYNFHPERSCAGLGKARALILGSLFRAPFDDVDVIRAVLTSAKRQGLLVIADTKLPNFRFLTLGIWRISCR